MNLKVKVGISNRHVHLTEDIYYKLFDSPLSKKKDLTQIGEFAANEMVKIETSKKTFDNVRIIGPFRKYNQVEISRSDARILGINPPVRKSGDLENSEKIKITTPKGSVVLDNCCIISERHIHMSLDDAKYYGVSDEQIVKVLINGDKSCILYAHIKVSDNGILAFHIDIDDANAAGLQNDDEVEIII